MSYKPTRKAHRQLIWEGLDFSEEDLRRVRSLLDKHNDVFSKDGDDIGYCDAIPHQIVTVDDRPSQFATGE